MYRRVIPAGLCWVVPLQKALEMPLTGEVHHRLSSVEAEALQRRKVGECNTVGEG